MSEPSQKNGKAQVRPAADPPRPRMDEEDLAACRVENDTYRELFQQSQDPVIITDAKGAIVEANPAAVKLLGLAEDQIPGLEFQKLYVDSTDGKRFVAAMTKHGSVHNFGTRLVGAKGLKIDCLFTATPRLDPEGRLVGYHGIIRDVTTRRRTVAHLTESEARYRTLFEAAYDAIFLIRDGIFLDCNPTALNMFGCTREQIIGRSPFYFSPPSQPGGEISEQSAQEKMSLALKGESQFFEWRHRRLDGRDFEAEVHLNRLSLSEQMHLLAFVRDITPRKHTETALRQSEERFRLLSENAPDIIYTLNLEGAFSYVNPAWQRILGHKPAEVLGNHFIAFVEPSEKRRFLKLFKTIRDHKRTLSDVDGRLVAKDGTYRRFSLSGAPNLDAEGKMIGMVGIFRDISVREMAHRQLEVQKAYTEQFIESSPEAIAVLENTDHIIRINPEFTRLFGYTPKEAEGRLINDLIVPEDLREEATALSRRTASGETVSKEGQRMRKDGALVEVSILGSPIQVDGGQVGVYGIYRNITDRKIAEKALMESEKKYRDLVENTHEGIVVLQNERIVFANAGTRRLGGYSEEEVLGKPFLDFILEEDQTMALEIHLQRLKGAVVPPNYQLRVKGKDGSLRWAEVNGMIIEWESRPATLYFLNDITQRKHDEEQIAYQAYHDALTGLPNRLLFNDRLTMAIAHAIRKESGLAVMFLDLDHFKNINDTLGHAAGDELLKSVAKRLSRWVRDEDTVARVGGDEFILLLQDAQGPGFAQHVARRILDSFTTPFRIKDQELYVSASIGITMYPTDGTDPEVLVSNADLAMYQAKDEGRGNFKLFTPSMNVQMLKRMDLEARMRKALENQEFIVHYQPKVSTDQGRVVGTEALVRWKQPGKGLIRPDEFIPVAEETGLIVPLGEWVLETACVQTKQLQEQGFPGLEISVNLSPRQFRQRQLVRRVEYILKKTDLDPKYLELEVTENVVMSNVEKAAETLKELSQLGVQLSMDDFGRGYSSLYHLKRFPMSALKIDRSFVLDVANDPDDASIVNTIISMSRSLNLKVVAEGVETMEQLGFLCEHQCDQMQGFLFSQPLSLEDLVRFMAHQEDISKLLLCRGK